VNLHLARQTGSALLWRGVHLGAVRLVSLLQILVLARLLAPSDFGVWSVASVTLWSVLHVTDLGMIPALVQRTEADPEHYHAAWTLGVIRGAAIALSLFAAAPLVADAFAQPRAATVLRVLALRPLLEALASIRMAELTRRLAFRALAAIHVPAVLTEAAVSVALARSLGVWAFVAGALSGALALLALSYALAPHQPRLRLRREAALPLVRYGRWVFLSGVVAVAGDYGLRMVISRRLGAAELGFYFLAAKLAFLPSDIASQLIGEVTFPLYSRLQSDRSAVTRAWQAMLTGTAALLLPVFALIIALAPAVVPAALGQKWAGAVPVIRLLAVVGILGLFGDTVVPVLKGLGHPHKVTALEATQSTLIIAFAAVLAAQWGLLGAAGARLPAILCSLVLNALFARQLMPRCQIGLARPVLAVALTSLACGAVAYAAVGSWPGIGGAVAAACGGALASVALFRLLDRQLRLRLLDRLAAVFPEAAAMVGDRHSAE